MVEIMPRLIYLFSTSSHPDTISVNSLEITLLKPKIDFSKYDYFIITSKQVSESLKHYTTKTLKPALCISSLTASSYASIGGNVLDIGSGYGDNLEKRIKSYSKDTRWLYLRAKLVASDFVSRCKEEGYLINESIMYESQCSKEIQNVIVKDDSCLIFTSPSSVKCFLNNHKISEESKVIVIGKTTAKALPSNVNYSIAKSTTIESCLKEV